MARSAWNKASVVAKRRYFELIRTGVTGSAAAEIVGVSLSCGSLWFIDAGSVSYVESPVSRRYLSQDERIEIADGLMRGEPVKVIAARIGRCYQTIYREIARNRKPDGRYQPWFAQNQAHVRRRRPKPRRFTVDVGLREAVANKLARRWSPAQISRWLRRRHPGKVGWQVCPETIYEAVYRGLVVPVDRELLRTGRTYRHRRGRGRTRDGALKQSTTMRSIHDRPAHVERRRQVGHWEGDLIVGTRQRSAIATLVERKTRFTVLVKLGADHCAQAVGDALITMLNALPRNLRKTLTWDQGNEMFHHKRIEKATGVKIYFADPHSPWQRGTNENTNGLIRQYLPKGTDLNIWSNEQLDHIAAELNNRPRECLNDKSPHQMMRLWKNQPVSA